MSTDKIESFFYSVFLSDLGDMKVHFQGGCWHAIQQTLIAKCPAIKKDIKIHDGYPMIDWSHYPEQSVKCFVSYLYTGKMYCIENVTSEIADKIHKLFAKYDMKLEDALTMDLVEKYPYEMMLLSQGLGGGDIFAQAVKMIRQRLCKGYAPCHLFRNCPDGSLCQTSMSAEERKLWLKSELVKFHKSLPHDLKTYVLSGIMTSDEMKKEEEKKKKEEEKKKKEDEIALTSHTLDLPPLIPPPGMIASDIPNAPD